MRKQAADDCHELRALHRHLYGRSLFWLGVCTKGQKFRLFPPHFFFYSKRWDLGRDWDTEGLCRGLSWAAPFPFIPLLLLSPPPSIAACLTGQGGQRGLGWLEQWGTEELGTA